MISTSTETFMSGSIRRQTSWEKMDQFGDSWTRAHSEENSAATYMGRGKSLKTRSLTGTLETLKKKILHVVL